MTDEQTKAPGRKKVHIDFPVQTRALAIFKENAANEDGTNVWHQATGWNLQRIADILAKEFNRPVTANNVNGVLTKMKILTRHPPKPAPAAAATIAVATMQQQIALIINDLTAVMEHLTHIDPHWRT